ncbi:MAG: UTP--glucose-1-phosphate uridylyltransferase, partial [Bryobacteraceae bacterium]
MKLIEGVEAASGDPEFGVSRGCLLPKHRVLPLEEVSLATRQKLQDSLVLVHGGMAQDVGPVLEMVTEKYLLRSEPEWTARREAIAILDTVVAGLRAGDVKALGAATERNFFGPIQTIIPWAGNLYTETLIGQVRGEMGKDFWGFWMLGGMSGGGMGFIFNPEKKPAAQDYLQTLMCATKRRLERAVPFAMDPVVYDFAINEQGASAALLTGRQALLTEGYYNLMVPALLRLEPRMLPASRRAELDAFAAACRARPEQAGMIQGLFDRLLPQAAPEESRKLQTLEELLDEYGFDRVQHEQIQADLRSGRIGLAQNRLPASVTVEDVRAGDVVDACGEAEGRLRRLGEDALAAGSVAVVSLAGGSGTRWTRGAGVVKALNPFCKFAGKYRNFLDLHLAKSVRAGRLCGTPLPHVVTTSHLTHGPIRTYLEENIHYKGPL